MVCSWPNRHAATMGMGWKEYLNAWYQALFEHTKRGCAMVNEHIPRQK